MKVLLATYWAVPHLGGVWGYMLQLKEKLESLGHTVDLLGYGPENEKVYIVNKNLSVPKEKIIPLLEAKLNPQMYPEIHANNLVKYTEFQRYCYELSAAYLGIDKYDIIHTQDILATACISRIKPKHIPLIATLHGSVAHAIHHQLEGIHKEETGYMARVYYDDLEKIGATSSDLTIVANQWLKNILVNEFGVPANHIKVLHYGFETEKFLTNMKQKSNIEPPLNKKVIIYAGRLVELKGVQHLLQALQMIKSSRQDWVCWIVGSGPDSDEFRKQTKELGLDEDVFFFGKREDIPYLLSISDIFVLPSLVENQPLAVIEAQIAGKAILVSDAGGLPEIVMDGVTGIVTPVGDVNALYSQLLNLLDDDSLRKKLGTNAKKWGMTHWSMDRQVKLLVDEYKSLIKSYKERRKKKW